MHHGVGVERALAQIGKGGLERPVVSPIKLRIAVGIHVALCRRSQLVCRDMGWNPCIGCTILGICHMGTFDVCCVPPKRRG